MMLFYCTLCEDVVALPRIGLLRSCGCGACCGRVNRHDDGKRFELHGESAIPLGLDHRTLNRAINERPSTGAGPRVHVYVHPTNSPILESTKHDQVTDGPPPAALQDGHQG